MKEALTSFRSDIYEPIAEWVGSSHRPTIVGEIRASALESDSGRASFRLWLGERPIITATFAELGQDERPVAKLVPRPIPTDPRVLRLFEREPFRGSTIVGAGSMIADSGHGFNLVLVGSDASNEVHVAGPKSKMAPPYSAWRVLRNTNDPSACEHRREPEPFAFTIAEIEQEIAWIGSMYAYDVHVEPLACERHITELIDLAMRS